MAEYLELERVLDDKNIITVQAKEYGSIDVIPVDTITDIELSDVQPVKHGRWTYPYKDKDINQCSECHSYVQDKISNVREMFAYCPFCGARMDGETK